MGIFGASLMAKGLGCILHFGGLGFTGSDPGHGPTPCSSSYAVVAFHIEEPEWLTIRIYNYVLGLWGEKKRGRSESSWGKKKERKKEKEANRSSAHMFKKKNEISAFSNTVAISHIDLKVTTATKKMNFQKILA